MLAKLAYVAAAINRFNQSSDISPSSKLIAFGSSALVALWNVEGPNDDGILETLPGNQGLITCVKFINEDALVSANDTGLLTLWKRHASTTKWESTISIQAHSKSISTACVLGECIITGSSDSLIKVWKIVEGGEKDEIIETQSINLMGRLPLISALTSLPRTKASILAVAGTDTKVQLWICSDDQFVHSATLAGHEDWIRSLAFNQPISDSDPLILASGSQDATIRLWNIEPWDKVSTSKSSAPKDHVDDLLDSFEASLGDLGENEEGGIQISLKHHILTVKMGKESSQQYSVTFDALLIGHEAGVTSLSWRPDNTAVPTLLSTSTDSSVILWSPSAILESIENSIWVNRQRFGDIGGQRLGGFIGGLWAINGTEALAWGWAGGCRRWRCTGSESNTKNETWTEAGAITGHNGPVKGLDWSPDGKYVISTGLDQTTRIHGPIHLRNSDEVSWHEIARPQVHGYDLLNVIFINPLRFASIADEKVVRVFEAPRGFVESAVNLGIAQFGEEEQKRPLSANVPPLGLSNKAISDGPQALVGELDSSRRPFDGELASITLWPEIEKIFGHGYESVTLGISHSHRLIATACKSTNAEHAVVRVYNTDDYKPVGEPLQGHVLTVTRIAFSPDDRYILSVSRDRSWRLFGVQTGGLGAYSPVAADKSHGRIIWDCGWSAEGDVFATASRDKTVKIWGQSEGAWKAITIIKAPQAATAVAFTIENLHRRRQLAVGLENGEIMIYSNKQSSPSEWRLDETITSKLAHVAHIHRMAWRPSTGEPHELATCSDDGTLRILRVWLKTD